MTTTAKQITALIAAAKKDASCTASKMSVGIADAEIGGRAVRCRVNPVRTNGRTLLQTTFYIDGEKASKAAVAAL